MPRQLRPADMAIIDVTDDDGTTRKALALLGPSGSFPADTLHLHQGLISKDLFHLDPGLAADQSVDAIEVGRVYFTDTATGITAGDLLLFVGKRGSDLVKLVLRVVAVVPEPALKRVRVDVEALPDPVAAAAAADRHVVDAVCAQADPRIRQAEDRSRRLHQQRAHHVGRPTRRGRRAISRR